MAATLTVEHEHILGDVKFIEGTILMDDSYPTNGEAIDLTDYLSEIYILIPKGRGGYVYTWDATNSKIKAFYGDYSESADGPLVECLNTTNLSTETLDFFAIGMP